MVRDGPTRIIVAEPAGLLRSNPTRHRLHNAATHGTATIASLINAPTNRVVFTAGSCTLAWYPGQILPRQGTSEPPSQAIMKHSIPPRLALYSPPIIELTRACWKNSKVSTAMNSLFL